MVFGTALRVRRSLRLLAVSLAVSGVCTPTLAQGGERPGSQTEPGAAKPPPARGPTWETRRPPNPVAAPVRFDPEFLDFGDVAPDAKVQGRVRMINSVDRPIEIESVQPACACSVAELDTKVVAPGRSAELTIGFTAQPAPAFVDTGVDIVVKDYAQPIHLRTVAHVNYGIRAVVNFEPEHQRREGRIELTSVHGRPFRVLSANFRTPVFLDGFEPSTDEPRQKYSIRWDLTGIEAPLLPKRFIVETDDSESPIIDLPVENLEWEPERRVWAWAYGTPRIMMGVLSPGLEREAIVPIRVHGGAPGEPEVVSVEPAGATAVMEESSRDGSLLKARLRVRPNPEARGAFAIKVRLRLLDCEREIELYGRIAADSRRF